MTRPELLAADHIRHLVQGFTTTERVEQPQLIDGRWRPTARFHSLQHPPLLTQLQDAVTGASARADEDAARGAFGSKPAAHLEAVDVLARIRTEASELAHRLDVPVYRQTSTAAILLGISGKVGDKPHPQVHRWWVSARLATQWDLRPFQPVGAPCPNCWEVKSLRIDLTDELARCVECHQVWDGPTQVANLAQHVKWCSDHDVTKARHLVLVDEHAGGQLVACPDCAAFREDYQAWQAEQAQAEQGERVSA